jgi:hypothetical protein
MVQNIEGKVGTVYYCPLDRATYQVTGDHSAVRVTDPAKIASGQDVRISNWRNFSLENDPGGRPAGDSQQRVFVGMALPPPVNGQASSGAQDSGGAGGSGGSQGGKKPARMPEHLWQYCVDAGRKTGIDPHVLAAQMERESGFGQGLHGDPGAGDGLMQVEPGTRRAYADKFRQQIGHAYNHNDPKDQVALAAVIMASKGGNTWTQLVKYNGGDNWQPGARDSYGREIHAETYANAVMRRTREMQGGA